MNVINFHLTNKCNYRCTYCFGKFPDKEELTLNQACAVVDNIYRYFVRNKITDGRINLAGGEPLLYSHLDELIDYISCYGIRVSIITNGSLLSKERIALWKGKVHCIGLSLDSALTETNAAIGRCCKGRQLSLRDAISITQAIHRNGIQLKINTVVSKLNVNEDMRLFYKRLKPDRLKFLQVEIVDGINAGAQQYAISKKEFNQFCKRHRHCCNNAPVTEQSGDMENSYLMINPQGEFQLNDSGEYRTYGNCLEEELSDIIVRAPIDIDRFNLRYTSPVDRTAGKSVCIFGGHDSWIKVMRQRLPNAKFSKEDVSSLDVIRNAEEIWIQPNAISHSFYGKILTAARSCNVTVKYFGYASASKCVEQVKVKKCK